MKTFDELITAADKIRDEVLPMANTGSRVGGLMGDIISKIEETGADMGNLIAGATPLQTGESGFKRPFLVFNPLKENLDDLNTHVKCAEYHIVHSNTLTGTLFVVGDSMKHTVNQILIGNWITEPDGSFNWSHQDGIVNILSRSYNISAPHDFTPKGTWSKWIRMATEYDIRVAQSNSLRYFGGVLDSCTIETSPYANDISLENVYYTQRAASPGFPVQYIPTFVGKVGDKYYKQFKNISSYSQTGINLDADKIYVDVNDKVMYVADPNFLYGVIRIGSERAVTQEEILTQAEYDALGSYDDHTRYYIIEG